MSHACDALLNPLGPIIFMYAHGIVRMALDPYGAADITPNGFEPDSSVPSGGTIGWVGKNGTKCFFLQMVTVESRRR